ncbi:MAG: 3'-5' exonuclease [Candidatus Saganbacteria bacterium]|nr:3'-5' exonuclease [Candidatus Saganbacteria bacterium]
MIADLLSNPEFQRLEKEYKFLSRARAKVTELENFPYIVLDIETTGLEPAKHEITEIAALKIEKKEVVDIFNTLIKPKQKIPYQITQLTGITQEMVDDKPSFKEIIPQFLTFIKGFNLVAHNSAFDIPFIKHHLGLNDKTLDNKTLCSLKISRLFLPQLRNHKLNTVAEHFGITAKNRHRAMGDVEATFQLWFKLLELSKKKNIYDLDDLLKIC